MLLAQTSASCIQLEGTSLLFQAGAASSEEQLDKQSPWELFDEGVTVSSSRCMDSTVRGKAQQRPTAVPVTFGGVKTRQRKLMY